MAIYKVPVYYSLCEYVYVEADGPEEARDWVEDNKANLEIDPSSADYLEDSYEVESNSECYDVVQNTPGGHPIIIHTKED